MAIAPLGTTESGVSSRTKLNAAIVEANKVPNIDSRAPIRLSTTGTVGDAISATATPAISVLSVDHIFAIHAQHTNTTAGVTIKIGSLDPIPVVNQDGGALTPGEYIGGRQYVLKAFIFGATQQLRIVSSNVLPATVKATADALAVETISRQVGDETVLTRLARSALGANKSAERQGFYAGGLLDTLPRPWAAYGFNRLWSDYSGSVARMRKTVASAPTGGTLYDVSADENGRMSSASAMGLEAAWDSRFYVNRLYDLSGNGRNADGVVEAELGASLISGDPSVFRASSTTRFTVPGSTGFIDGLAGATIAVLIKPDGTLPAADLTAINIPGIASGSFRLALRFTTTGRFQSRAIASGSQDVQAVGPIAGADWLVAIARADFAAGKLTLWQDGTQADVPMNVGAIAGASADPITLLNYVSSTAVSGRVGGIAIYREALSDRLLPVLGEAMLAARPNAAWKRLARIAYMTDMHCSPSNPQTGTRYPADSPDKINDALAWFNGLSEPADLLVIGGDSIDGRDGPGNYEDLATVKALMAGWQGLLPPLYLLGNHDMPLGWLVPKAQILAALGSTRPPYGSMDVGGVHVVWLDACYKADDDGAGYDVNLGWTYTDTWIPPSQRAWLAADLAGTKLPVVIFCHQALDRALGANTVKNSNAVLDIIIKSRARVLGALCGHAHQNMRWLYGGVPSLRMQALVEGQRSAGAGAYSLIDVYENRIVVTGRAGQTSYNV